LVHWFEGKEEMANRVELVLVISLVLVLSISSALGAESPAPSAMQQAGNAASGAVEKGKENVKNAGESWGQWLTNKWE
jgi:hypothetical protein